MKAADFSRAALTFYEKTLLTTSRSLLTYAQFGEKFPMKDKSGKTINFARYADLSAATTELGEAITPVGSKILKSEITATLRQYGDWVGISDVTTMTGFDPEITIAAEKLGRQQGLTLDTVLRNELMQGTNEVWANGKTSRETIKDKIQKADFQKIHRFLRSNDVPMITKMIDPSTGIATQPVPAAYIAIGHTDMITDLEDLEASGGFVPVHKYASSRGVFEGEVGTLAGIRFILTSNAPILYAAGGTPSTGIQASVDASKVDVYQTIIFGEGAFAEVPLNKGNSGIIIKAKGAKDTMDTSDPLNQRSTVGWKTMWAGLILDDSRIVRYEHGVTA